MAGTADAPAETPPASKTDAHPLWSAGQVAHR